MVETENLDNDYDVSLDEEVGSEESEQEDNTTSRPYRLYELNPFGEEIFKLKYAAYKGEPWYTRARTVATHVAQIEPNDRTKAEWGRYYFEAIAHGDFCPGGRILFGAGRHNYNLLNCYVIEPNDSVESIGKTIQDMYKISCAGGGIGFNFSKIRPKGDDIQNINNSAPGSVSVMKMINEIGNHVKAGKNRRTALMGILEVTHPDLFEFLHVKLDLGQLNNFNISVGINNAFIEACENDSPWYFTFNHKKYYVFEGLRCTFDENDNPIEEFCQVVALNEADALARATLHHLKTYKDTFKDFSKKTIYAKDIFRLLWDNAVKSGDPGIYNVSLANSYTNVSYFESMPATNPCLAKGSLVHTPNGYLPVEDIKEGDLITTIEGIARPIQTIETHTNLDVYKVTFTDGSEQIATAQHQFYVLDGKFVKPKCVKDLTLGDKVKIATAQMPALPTPNKPDTISDRDYGLMLGIVYGDGCYTENQISKDSFKISTSIEDNEWNNEIIRLFGAPTSSYRGVDSKGRENKSLTYCFSLLSEQGQIIHESLMSPAKAIDKTIPLELINTNQDFLAGLLDGLFSTDGNVNLKSSSPMIRFTTGSKDLANSVKRILSMFGIYSSIYSSIRKEHMFDGRRIRSNSLKYDVVLNASSFLPFYNKIGCSNPKKLAKIKKAALFGGYSYTIPLVSVKSIEAFGKSDVYDLYEPITDTWISEGIVSRGCGEIPLPSYGNCCLGHVNLAHMVDENGNFNWRKLAKTIRIGIRFLDSVLEINHFPVPETREVAHKSRRIGLGVMGYHYMLIKLGLKYGSEKCLEFTERLAETFRNEAYKASIKLARLKGAFPEYHKNLYKQEEFYKTLPYRIRQAIDRYGIRNAVMLTSAPTGSISIVHGVSSGIEPIFAPIYKRRYKVGNDVWAEEVILDPLFAEYLEARKPIDHFIGAYELTAEEHLSVQAIWQRYIDSAISKTINLPENAVGDDFIDEAFQYLKEVKGLTVYRAGSKGNEPLEAIPTTAENIKKYVLNNKTSKQTKSADVCDLTSGECG